MYRDVVAVARSVYRLSLTDPWLRVFYILGRLSGRLTALMSPSLGQLGSRVGRLDNELIPGLLFAGVATETYLDARRRGLDISALRYEDLVARPLDMCRVVLAFCRLPVSLAQLAVRAFDDDSQRDSFAAKSKMAHIKQPPLTPETKARLNELLKQFAMPLIGEPGIIEGTLTCS